MRRETTSALMFATLHSAYDLKAGRSSTYQIAASSPLPLGQIGLQKGRRG